MSSSPMPIPDVIAAGQQPCCRYARFHADRPRRERFYPSDMTDAEWAVLEPLLPAPACATAAGGHPERYCRREIVDALRYDRVPCRGVADQFRVVLGSAGALSGSSVG